MYKVFVKEQPLILSTSPDAPKGAEIVEYTHINQLKQIFYQLNNSASPQAYHLYSANLSGLWADFCSLFKIVEAAGGLVQNPQGQYLFIERLGYWDLPKGKIDSGEGTEEAALREVEEECGITGLSIAAPAGLTYHTYEHKGHQVLKFTYWYLMQTSFDGPLVPQTEEDITQAVWLDKTEISSMVLPRTYASIAELLATIGL